MLAGVEALEAIPRVQIERVQQYVSALILEFGLFIRKEIRPAKEFTQKVRYILVLLLRAALFPLMRRPVEAMAKGSSQSEQVLIVDRSILV